MNKPLFVVFEGIDGAGKSTQAKRLASYLISKSIPVLLTAEPSDSPDGLKIRSLGTRLEPELESELFEKDRHHHVENVILPALSESKFVICDRYVYSSVAYQGARGLCPQEILKRNFSFAPRPNVVFLIEIPVNLAIERIRKNRGDTLSAFEKIESLKEVDKIYKSLVEREIVRIDGKLDEDVISQIIIEIVKTLFNKAPM
ncbi:MAG: dTMP kinase [Desulfomonilaceae bacterium]